MVNAFIFHNIYRLTLSFGALPRRVLICGWVACAIWVWLLEPAWALEKYGRPLPSMEEQGEGARESEETLFGAYFLSSPFVSNPSFAGRPDNTGLVGLRHMMHLETDLYKQYLTFYTDQKVFSDRTDEWIKLIEWDMTYALTGACRPLGLAPSVRTGCPTEP